MGEKNGLIDAIERHFSNQLARHFIYICLVGTPIILHAYIADNIKKHALQWMYFQNFNFLSLIPIESNYTFEYECCSCLLELSVFSENTITDRRQVVNNPLSLAQRKNEFCGLERLQVFYFLSFCLLWIPEECYYLLEERLQSFKMLINTIFLKCAGCFKLRI